MDSYGPNLGVLFEVPQVCPMMRCVKDSFRTPFDLITHLRVCDKAGTGEVRCPTCDTCHPIKNKGHAHLLKSPVTLLQKQWSVRKQAKQNRNASPALTSTGSQVQEADFRNAEDSDTSGGTDMPHQLQSESLYELQDPSSNWNHIHEAAAEPERHSTTVAPPYGQFGQAAHPQQDVQNNFTPSFFNQPPTKQSWSDNSQRSTLFEASLQDMEKQLSIDMMSIQSSNGSYHDGHYVPAGQSQMPPHKDNMWLPGSDMTASPEDVEPSAKGQVPWKVQGNHGHMTPNSLAVQLGTRFGSNNYIDPSLNDATAFPSAAVEAATALLRRQRQPAKPPAPLPTAVSSFPPIQAQGSQFFSPDMRNISSDSYSSTASDRMIIDRPDDRFVASEAMSGFTANVAHHEGRPEALLPSRTNAVKVTKFKSTRQKRAQRPLAKSSRLPKTPLDELVCKTCGFFPTGEHTKNYRAHFKRHCKIHDEEAVTTCPVPGCEQTFRGDRDDNVQDHLKRMHPDTPFETMESASIMGIKRSSKRKPSQTTNMQVDRTWSHGSSDALGFGVQSHTMSADAINHGGVQMTRTPVSLMGISADINTNTKPPERGNNQTPALQTECDLSQIGPWNITDRQYVLGYNPWALVPDEGAQGTPFQGHNNNGFSGLR